MQEAPLVERRATLQNARSREIIAERVELALTRRQRRRGLLNRSALAPDAALVLAPCFAIHTAFMQFAIDVIFVDRQGFVQRIVRNLKPWRIVASPKAYAAIELAAGALDTQTVREGDQLRVGMAMSLSFRETAAS